MSELRELYQEMILDHGKRPRHFEALADADGSANGHNPLCGDKLTVFLKIDGNKIRRVTFQGSGCAISMASASMMSEALEGKSIENAKEVFRAFHELVTGKSDPEATQPLLGKLVVFTGVREFPVRVKCATLAWHTMMAAAEHRQEQVTTE